MAEPQITPLARRIVDRVDRLLRGAPVRIASVQFTRPIDLDRTTAAPSPQERFDDRRRLATLLWDPAEQGREARYREYREICDEVPELWRAVCVLRDFVFSGCAQGQSFVQTIAKDARPEVKRIAARVPDRLGLHSWLRQTVLEGLILGDDFTRMVFDQAQAVSLRGLQVERTMALGDEYGSIDGYLYRPMRGTARVDLALHPFEVIHYAPDRPKRSRYGRSLFVSGRKLRRQHDATLDILGVLTIKKAKGDERILWPFSGEATEDEIWKHVHAVQAELDDLYFDDAGEMKRRAAAQLDFAPAVVPYRVIDQATAKPEVVQTSAADLVQLVRVLEHLQQRYFITTGVPAAFAGLDRDTRAKASLGEQGLAFSLQVSNRQTDGVDLVADAHLRAMLVEGVVPEPGEVEVSIPRPAQFDEAQRAAVVKDRAAAASQLLAAGLPVRFVGVHTLGLSEEEATKLAEAVQIRAGTAGGVAAFAGSAEARELLERAAEAAAPDLDPVSVDLAERLDEQPEPPPGVR